MVQMSVRSNVGDSGIADVRAGKTSLRMTFKDSGIVYDLNPELWEGKPSGEFNVTLSRDNTKIVGVKPVPGTYIFMFDSIGNVVNEVPEPAIQRGGPRSSRDGKKKWFAPDSVVWRVNLTVESEGKYNGLRVMYQLPYAFTQTAGSPYASIVANSKRDFENLETFFRANNFPLAEKEIPFSSNVLPWLEKELKACAVPFMAKINDKGFVNDVSVLPAELRPRKTSKKGKK